MNQNGSPTLQQWITRSVALYRGLLVFYPPAFRRAYGAQLAQTFRDQCRQAVCEHGLPGLFGCWMSMLTDLASNALAERLTEGYTMSRATFIRLAGGLTLVSAVLLIPILFSTHTPPFTSGGVAFSVYGPCDATSTRFCLQTFTSGGVAYTASGNTLIYMVFSSPTYSSTFPLVAKLLTACCFAVGLLGVTLAQRSWPGRLAGGLALLGQVGTILFTFVFGGTSFGALYPLTLTLRDPTLLQLRGVLLPIFSLALGLGLIICGLIAFKEGTLGGWKGALLLLGLWLGIGNAGLWWLQWTNPVLYFEGTGFVWDAWGTSFFWISLGFTLYALITYALWGWLGFKLWVQKTPPEVQIQAALG